MKTYRAHAARKGFSLLEITLVVLIMGVLMTVAVVAIAPKIFGAKLQSTKSTMETISNELDTWHATNSAYPTSLNNLPLKKQPVVDGWRRQFYFSVPGKNGKPYDLISIGEDGIAGTQDDIDYWTMEQKQPGA